MQIVTDSGMDIAPQQMRNLNVHLIPMRIQLEGRSYRSGIDLEAETFYHLLEKSRDYPSTTPPSVEDFAALYRALAREDADILSIHISSGLSETVSMAQQAARMLPEANVRLIDSRTVSGALGWQVEAAVRAHQAGWTKEEILPLIKLISDNTDVVFTLNTLKYLVHGGRVSHLRGILGTLLDIKPVLGINKADGRLEQRDTIRTMRRATSALVDMVKTRYEPGTAMRFQIMHGDNAEAASLLGEELEKTYKCTFKPVSSIAPALGAHTGPGLIGLVYAPQETFARLPWERSSG